MEFAPGAQVSARGLAWDVLEVVPLGAQTLLRVRCAEGDLQGLDWELLHPAEPVEARHCELRPDAPVSLAAWRLYHRACLLDQVLGPADRLIAAPGRLRVEPYQLVPLMRLLELPRPRLLLADGVGLGKTVEAGLVVTELIARRRAHRVLVVAPSGPLLLQWRQEMRQRFGLRFTLVADAAALHEQRRRIELGGNPFNAIALCLTSLDFAKQERVLEELERAAWDLAIIDEAHHCIRTAGSDRDETQRRRLAEVVAQRSDGLLLLTATPHDGFDAHFASLIELLDPSLVNRHGSMAGHAYRRHVVRRLKSHLRDAATGAPLFRNRQVMPVRVAVRGGTVRRFHRALAALVAPRLSLASREREHADALAFVSLLKRSGSTIAACLSTLRVVAQRFAAPAADQPEARRRERMRALRAYRKRLLRFGVLDAAAESERTDLEADAMAANLQNFPAALGELIRLAEQAEPQDPKLAALIRVVRAIRSEQRGANILVYTEYADSQLAALHALRAAVGDGVLAINGLDDERERARVADRFAGQDGMILVSTDALAEGLNLHQRCRDLIHLDLPYNPNRLEQRNGRIDRYGQSGEPRIRYLYLADTFEEHLLLRLIAKYEAARQHLTFMPETLGLTADAAYSERGMVAGFAERTDLFDAGTTRLRTLDRAAEDSDVEAFHALRQEIERAYRGFDRSAVAHGWWDDRGSVPAAGAGCPQVDLLEFVRDVVGGSVAIDEDSIALPLPGAWRDELQELPGVDIDAGLLRLTRDRDRLRDSAGHSLACLGRAHPVVRHAVSRLQRRSDNGGDQRVSMARAPADGAMAVLLTYAFELRSALATELRQVVAVRLPRMGEPVALIDAQDWLPAGGPTEGPCRDAWHRLFACWVPRRLAEATAVATAAMLPRAEQFLTQHRQAAEIEAVAVQRWLAACADDICGPVVPRTVDLFTAEPPGPLWRTLRQPLDRLAAFAADGVNAPAPRRAAGNIVELHRRRAQDRDLRHVITPHSLRPLGLLMLLPPDAV